MSSSDPPSTLANFTFTTIGKQPDLLKRISAPQPNQHYQDTPTNPNSPSPSHSSTIQPEEPPSRPTLLQALAGAAESQTDSVIHAPIPHAQPRVGMFDKRAAALFATSSNNQESASFRQPSVSRDELMVKPESRLTSPDFTCSMELVYPATEPAWSRSPAPVPVRSAVIPSANPTDVDSPPRANLPTRILDIISTLDAATTRQLNILNNIASLEQDVQSVTAQTLSCLENAHRAEAVAQRSFATAKESLNIAQENVSLAQAAKDRVDQILIGLARLVLLCKDELTGERGRNLKHELEGFYRTITEQPGDAVVTQSTGLPPEVLQAMVAEIARKIHEHDRGLRKRKRNDDDDEGAEAGPFKEPRLEQSIMASDWFLEMEAEIVRKAWGQEAERRSTAPPDIIPDATLDQQRQGATAESCPNDAQQVERNISETGQQLVQAPATEQPIASSEQDLLFRQSVGSVVRGTDETEDALQAQRRCELEEQKLEIARFQIRERESQEQKTRNKETKKKDVTTLIQSQKKGEVEPGPTTSSAPTRTLVTSNVVTSMDGPTNPMQRKSSAADISRKKELEQRLAMEKQQASAAVQPGPAQAGTPPVLPDQEAILAKEGIPARQSDRLSGVKKDHAQRKIERQKVPAESAKLKGRTNGASDINKPGKPKTFTAPNVGNVVAQQTLAMSPAKLKGRKSRIPQTPVTASSTVPPRSSSQLVLPITTQETAPRNIRLTSIPPIECIIEPTNPDLGMMEIPIMSPPVSQANGDDSRRVSLTKSATSVNVSAEAQSANLRFVQNAVPRTTEHISSGQTAQRPLRVSTDTVVPKVEIQSPMITQPLHPLPQKPPSSNSGIPDAPHLKTVRRPTPTGDMQTPHNERSRRSDENVDCAGVLDTNRGSNISSDTNTKKSVPSTSPLISPPVPYRNLFPQDEQSIDPARSSQQVNHETQRTFHQNDLPHAFLHGSGPSNTYPSYHRENVSISPPRSIGVKRPRDSARLDDMDGRHWSSGQEVVGRRDRLSRRRYDCRTPSGSPPLRFRDESRPLVERLEQIRESGVYRPSSGGETYIPNYASHSPADTADRERRRDDVEGYPVPSDSRPELLDRFSNMTNPQHPKRQNGPPLRGTARRGRRGAPLSLEQRIS